MRTLNLREEAFLKAVDVEGNINNAPWETLEKCAEAKKRSPVLSYRTVCTGKESFTFVVSNCNDAHVLPTLIAVYQRKGLTGVPLDESVPFMNGKLFDIVRRAEAFQKRRMKGQVCSMGMVLGFVILLFVTIRIFGGGPYSDYMKMGVLLVDLFIAYLIGLAVSFLLSSTFWKWSRTRKAINALLLT